LAKNGFPSTIASILKPGLRFLVLHSLTPFAAHAQPAGQQHAITYDHYSLMIDGKRIFIYSGEFHPFRLPSPDLWRDVFEKMKSRRLQIRSAVYFDWGLSLAKSWSLRFSTGFVTWTNS